MSLSTFKTIFDTQMKSYVETKIDLSKKILNHQKLNNFVDYFFDYVFQWGKRIRPYVLYLSYKGLWWQNDDEILRFGTIFELLHTMALIHDDIIDQAAKRHNVPTIHNYIDSQIHNMHIAEWQAILFWDLVLSRVYELQNKSFAFPSDLIQRARINIHDMIEELILGQMIDVDTMTWETLSEEHLEKKNLYKSAKYSFSRPMTTGAILAWANYDQLQMLEDLWIAMGLAFQIRDDLMDLVQHDTSKSIFSDIQEGQQTIFTNYIYTKGSPSEKTLLHSCMGKKLDTTKISELQNMLHTSGAIEYGKNLIADYGSKAFTTLEKINMNTQEKQNFKELIEKIISIKI